LMVERDQQSSVADRNVSRHSYTISRYTLPTRRMRMLSRKRI
jgi:hypothetical protein